MKDVRVKVTITPVRMPYAVPDWLYELLAEDFSERIAACIRDLAGEFPELLASTEKENA